MAAANPTLLIVEADVLIRQQLSDYLRECGFEVVAANSTDEAVEVLKSNDFTVDLVLADIDSVGKVDGFGLAKWVRLQASPAEVILTGSAHRIAERATELCDESPVEAPYHPQQLMDRIRQALEARRSLRDAADR